MRIMFTPINTKKATALNSKEALLHKVFSAITTTFATRPNAYPRLRYSSNDNHEQPSTFWLRNGRFLRLKNLDIGYTMPKPWVNAIHLENVRIYISGQNLITWSAFDLWDPELDSDKRGEEYPITRSFTAGIQISL